MLLSNNKYLQKEEKCRHTTGCVEEVKDEKMGLQSRTPESLYTGAEDETRQLQATYGQTLMAAARQTTFVSEHRGTHSDQMIWHNLASLMNQSVVSRGNKPNGVSVYAGMLRRCTSISAFAKAMSNRF